MCVYVYICVLRFPYSALHTEAPTRGHELHPMKKHRKTKKTKRYQDGAGPHVTKPVENQKNLKIPWLREERTFQLRFSLSSSLTSLVLTQAMDFFGFFGFPMVLKGFYHRSCGCFWFFWLSAQKKNRATVIKRVTALYFYDKSNMQTLKRWVQGRAPG